MVNEVATSKAMEPLNIPVLAPVSVKVTLSTVVSVSLLLVAVIVSAVPLLLFRSLSVTRKYSVLLAGKFNCSAPSELVRRIEPVEEVDEGVPPD